MMSQLCIQQLEISVSMATSFHATLNGRRFKNSTTEMGGGVSIWEISFGASGETLSGLVKWRQNRFSHQQSGNSNLHCHNMDSNIMLINSVESYFYFEPLLLP